MPVPDLKPGATYKFVVRSTDEAVRTIREQLGENAKVLSVRQLKGEGITGLFARPKLEVVAQIIDPAASPALVSPALVATSASEWPPSPALLRSEEPALPAGFRENSSASRLALNAPLTSAAARNPERATRLPEVLRRSGFSEALLGRLQATPAFAGHEQKPLHHAFAEVGRALRHAVESRPRRPLPARTAFLGTPGVGRTTALCKWLAREVFTRGRAGRVIKAEFDRPNPAEGLAVFCEALGLSLEHYSPPAPPVAASASERPPSPPQLADTGTNNFLYADLPGLSLHNPADNTALAHFLDREKFDGRVLVLNAAYDLPMLRRAYTAGRDLGATHVVFTHLDELEHWGKLWDFLIEGELAPLFLATGPSLTGDCEEDAFTAILRRTLPGA